MIQTGAVEQMGENFGNESYTVVFVIDIRGIARLLVMPGPSCKLKIKKR